MPEEQWQSTADHAPAAGEVWQSTVGEGPSGQTTEGLPVYSVTSKQPSTWDRMVSAYGEFVNPLGEPTPGEPFEERFKKVAEGLSRVPLEMSQSASGFGNAVLHGDLPGAAHHLVGLIPFLGPGAQQVEQDVREGKWPEAIAHTAGLITMARPDLPEAGLRGAARGIERGSEAVATKAREVAPVVGEYGKGATVGAIKGLTSPKTEFELLAALAGQHKAAAAIRALRGAGGAITGIQDVRATRALAAADRAAAEAAATAPPAPQTPSSGTYSPWTPTGPVDPLRGPLRPPVAPNVPEPAPTPTPDTASAAPQALPEEPPTSPPATPMPTPQQAAQMTPQEFAAAVRQQAAPPEPGLPAPRETPPAQPETPPVAQPATGSLTPRAVEAMIAIREGASPAEVAAILRGEPTASQAVAPEPAVAPPQAPEPQTAVPEPAAAAETPAAAEPAPATAPVQPTVEDLSRQFQRATGAAPAEPGQPVSVPAPEISPKQQALAKQLVEAGINPDHLEDAIPDTPENANIWKNAIDYLNAVTGGNSQGEWGTTYFTEPSRANVVRRMRELTAQATPEAAAPAAETAPAPARGSVEDLSAQLNAELGTKTPAEVAAEQASKEQVAFNLRSPAEIAMAERAATEPGEALRQWQAERAAREATSPIEQVRSLAQRLLQAGEKAGTVERDLNPQQFDAAAKAAGIANPRGDLMPRVIDQMRKLEAAAEPALGLEREMAGRTEELELPQAVGSGIAPSKGIRSSGETTTGRTTGPTPANEGETISGTGSASASGGQPRAPSAQYGEDTSVRIPGENRGLAARYTVREAEDVIPSHNPHNLEPNPDYSYRNDRNYKDPRNAERIIKQVSEFDPYYVVTDAPDATNGAPVIDRNGHVLGGNSRTMTIQRVYDTKPEAAQAYKDLLVKKAAQFGLDPNQIRGMRRPVLVRELGEGLTPEEAQAAITDLNKSGTAALTGAERAIADSNKLSESTLNHIAGMIESHGQEGTLAKALEGRGGNVIANLLVNDGVITTQEKPTLFDTTGALTASAKDRISKLMLGRLFADSEHLERTPPAVRNKLERIMAPLARVATKAEWDITPQVRDAMTMLEEARAAGITNLDDLMSQQSLFGEARKYSPEVVSLAKAIHSKGPRQLQDAFQQYASDSTAGPMFGEVSPRQSFVDAFAEGQSK